MPLTDQQRFEEMSRDENARRRTLLGIEKRKYCYKHHAYECENKVHKRELHWLRLGIGLLGAIVTFLVGGVILSLWQAFGWWLLIGIVGVFMAVLAVYAYGWMILATSRLLSVRRRAS